MLRNVVIFIVGGLITLVSVVGLLLLIAATWTFFSMLADRYGADFAGYVAVGAAIFVSGGTCALWRHRG